MADFDLAKERAKFLGVFPNAHWTDGATCPDQTWAINTWQGWLAARRQHGSAAQAVAPSKRDILAICDAYESGIGHGLQRDGHKSGAIFANPECGEAYEIGYAEGDERASGKKPKVAAPPVADAEGVMRQALNALLHAQAGCSGTNIDDAITALRAALSRRPAAEQPAAAGNALTDGLFGVIRAFGYTTSRQTAEIVEAIEQHLRAAPQAALVDAARAVLATELGELASTGSMSPCEHALGLLKDAAEGAPQAAQGEGLTDRELSKAYLKAENHTKGLRAVANRAFAAHTAHRMGEPCDRSAASNQQEGVRG